MISLGQLQVELDRANGGEHPSAGFLEWLNRATVDALQAANEAHFNNRSRAGFRIDSGGSGVGGKH